MSVVCAEPVRAAAKLLSAEPILLQPLAVSRFLGHVSTRSTYAPNLDRGPDGDQGEAPRRTGRTCSSLVHPSGVVLLTASGVAVYSLDLLGGQPRDVIGERTGHDLGIEALEQRDGGEPLPLRGSLAASRLPL